MKKYSDYGMDYNYSYSAPKNEEEARKRLLAILNNPKARSKKDFTIPIVSIKKVKAVSHDKKFILPKVKPKKQPEFKVPKVKAKPIKKVKTSKAKAKTDKESQDIKSKS
jgi:hypothetical protein